MKWINYMETTGLGKKRKEIATCKYTSRLKQWSHTLNTVVLDTINKYLCFENLKERKKKEGKRGEGCDIFSGKKKSPH